MIKIKEILNYFYNGDDKKLPVRKFETKQIGRKF